MHQVPYEPNEKNFRRRGALPTLLKREDTSSRTVFQVEYKREEYSWLRIVVCSNWMFPFWPIWEKLFGNLCVDGFKHNLAAWMIRYHDCFAHWSLVVQDMRPIDNHTECRKKPYYLLTSGHQCQSVSRWIVPVCMHHRITLQEVADRTFWLSRYDGEYGALIG